MNPIQLSTFVLASLCALEVTQDRAGAQQELFRLHASDAVEGQAFGWTVGSCGNLLVVGVPNDQVNGVGSGSAYIFDQATGQERFKLVPADGKPIDDFGTGVAINAELALIGAPRTDDVGYNGGSVYVFDVLSGQELFEWNASDGMSGANFGNSVSISGDRAVVGARGGSGGTPVSGSAYVLDLTSGQEVCKLIASDGASADAFGWSVSIHGNRALVGAVNDDDNGLDSGSGYLFDATTGQQLFKLLPADGMVDDRFGVSVSMSGERAVVGTYQYSPTNGPPGAAYVFDVATGQQLFKLLASDGESNDVFGWDVSVSGDVAVIGSHGDDDNGSYSGSAYLFDVTTGQELAKLLASDGGSAAFFGWGVSISGDRAAVGAFWQGHSGIQNAGAVYVYSVLTEPGRGYCFGDPGSGIPCPCNNDNDGSVPGSGCDNGIFPSGAHLSASGFAGVSGDSVVLTTTGLEPNNTGLYLQANNAVNGGQGFWFGDGLCCAGGQLRRLQIRFADAAGVSSTTISLSATGGVSPGDTRRYQCWYRTQASPACGLGVNEFNLSNGYEITWVP